MAPVARNTEMAPPTMKMKITMPAVPCLVSARGMAVNSSHTCKVRASLKK